MNEKQKKLMLIEEAAETPQAVHFSEDDKFCYLGYPFVGTTGVNTPTWKIKRVEFAENGDIYMTFVNGRKDEYSHVFAQCEAYEYAFAK